MLDSTNELRDGVGDLAEPGVLVDEEEEEEGEGKNLQQIKAEARTALIHLKKPYEAMRLYNSK